MSNNTDVIRTFVKRAALYIAEVKSLSIEDALSYVYNSDTFRILDEGCSSVVGYFQTRTCFWKSRVKSRGFE